MREDISSAETRPFPTEAEQTVSVTWASRLAAGGCAALIAASLLVGIHNIGPRLASWRGNLHQDILGLPPDVVGAYFVSLEAVAALGFLLTAILLACRHWRNRNALFVSVALATYGLTLSQLRDTDRAQPWLALGDALQVVGTWSFLMLYFVFPNGRFYPRWSRYPALAWTLLILAWYLFPELPLNLHHAATFNRTFFLSTLFTTSWGLLGLYCQWARYRSLDDRLQRQQIKWVLFGFFVASFITTLFFVVNGTIRALGYPLVYNHTVRAIAYPLMLLGHLAIPLSIGLAIEHLRLFDIDRVLQRTLAYFLVTGALGLSYLLLVLWAQTLVQQLFGEAGVPFFVALSTIAVAALFLPVHRRVQRLVGRKLRPPWSRSGPPKIAESAPPSLGGYRLLERVGSGGMATIFRAQHEDSQQEVAVKLLLEKYRGSTDAETRFRREATVVSELHHPSIVRMVDHGRAGDQLYLVMEFIHGPDLSQVLALSGRCQVSKVRSWIVQVGEALDYAHRQGVVHRDLKPSNIMLRQAEGEVDDWTRAVLTDFGLARVLDADTQFTATNAVGTVYYMSPEQIRSPSRVGPPSDIYSLGALTYHLLAGAPPFAADNAGAVLMAHLQTKPPDIRKTVPELTAEISGALRRALAKSPAHRFENAGEFAAALDPDLRSMTGAR